MIRRLSRKNARVITPAFLIIIVVSGWLAWRLPYGADEDNHLTVVRHHAHHLAFLDADDMAKGNLRGHQYHLFSPVAYAPYIALQLVEERVGPIDSAANPDRFITRLAGVGIGCVQLALTIVIVRRMCKACGDVEVAAVALAANLIPQLRLIHAYVNPDAITILAGTACFALALHILDRKRVTLVDAALAGLALAAIAHSKYNAYITGALLFGVVAFRTVRQSIDSVHVRLRLFGVVVALPLLLAGAFHLHVYDELKNGHVEATVDNEQLSDSTFAGAVATRPAIGDSVRRRIELVPVTWRTGWIFAPPYAEPHGRWLGAIAVACVAGLLGFAFLSGQFVTSSGRVVGLGAAAAFIVGWMTSILQWLVGPWGRFLLPAGVTALVAVVLGTGVLIARAVRVPRPLLLAAATWIVLLLSLNIWQMNRIAAA